MTIETPTKGSRVAAAAIFRYCPSDGFSFFWTITANANRHWKQNRLLERELPTHFRNKDNKKALSRNMPPEG